MNPTDLCYVVLLAFSTVLFLNKHGGKELLFRALYFRIKTSPGEYLRDKASPRFAKLWSCYFCQGAHAAHALSWCYGWWAGLSLVETCYLVLLATPVSAAACEMILGFFDDVQTLAGGASKINSPVNISDERMLKFPAASPPGKEITPTSENPQPPNPLEAYVAERKQRGYDIDIVDGPDGKQSVLVKHVPERERLWEAFHAGKVPTEVDGLPELWDTLKAEWGDKNCTRCEKTAVLAKHREEALKLIDTHLAQKNGKNTPVD